MEGLDNIDKLYDREKCTNPGQVRTIPENPRRIVVFGDIHGDYKLAMKMLLKSKTIKIKDKSILNYKYDLNIIDSKEKYTYLYTQVYQYIEWIGKDTIIVQVGDQIDRCRPYKNKTCDMKSTTVNDEGSDVLIIYLFTYLDKIAQQAGGQVVSLLGNHELMNIMGDMSYVSYKGAIEYSTKDNFTEGLNKRKEKFKKRSTIGDLLGCTRESAIIIGQHLFVHGGFITGLLTDEDMGFKPNDISANRARLEEINRLIKKWILEVDMETSELAVINKLISDPTKYSFYWNRLLGILPPKLLQDDNTCIKHISDVLGWFKIGSVIVGHTPQSFTHKHDINKTCGTGVWRVDNGSSAAFDQFDTDGKYTDWRQPQVLEILFNDKTKKYEYTVLK